MKETFTLTAEHEALAVQRLKVPEARRAGNCPLALCIQEAGHAEAKVALNTVALSIYNEVYLPQDALRYRKSFDEAVTKGGRLRRGGSLPTDMLPLTFTLDTADELEDGR